MNNIKTQQALTSIPPKDWVASQVVVFDWFDGPREGIARMAKPECEFAFELIAERHNPDGLDDRLFRVNELPAGSVGRVLEVVRSLGKPTNTVWVPVWNFGSEEELRRVDEEIDQIMSQQESTGIVITTRDMITFLGCWHEDSVRSEIEEWFSALDFRQPAIEG